MITLVKDGKKLSRWSRAEVSSNIDNCLKSYSFSTDRAVDIKAGDKCSVLVDGKEHARLIIEKVRKKAESNKTSYEGRDTASVLVDSNVPDEAKRVPPGAELVTIINKLITALQADITVNNNAGKIKPFRATEIIQAEAGENCFEFIEKYARKRGVYYTAGIDSIDIYRLGQAVKTEFSFSNSNTIDQQVFVDISGRYSKYKVKSQAEVGAGYDNKKVSREGTAEDKLIIPGRYREIVSDESMTAAECKERAVEEANIKRARSLNIKLKVDRHTVNDVIIQPGKLAKVRTDIGVNGVFLISSVRLRSDDMRGDTADITLTYPDAYSVVEKMNNKQKKRTDIDV